jgi:hypothetical protein
MTPRTGRPRLDPTIARLPLSARVRPSTMAWLTAEAERQGLTIGHLLDQIAEEAQARAARKTKPGAHQ